MAYTKVVLNSGVGGAAVDTVPVSDGSVMPASALVVSPDGVQDPVPVTGNNPLPTVDQYANNAVDDMRVDIKTSLDLLMQVLSATQALSPPSPTPTMPRLIVAAGSSVVRPANVTAYAANQAVSNNATAGSVTPIIFTAVDANNAPLTIDRCRIATNDTGPSTAGAAFRIWFYSADPTANSGVVGGNGATYSTKQGNFIGSMTGTFFAFSDGGVAICTPETGSRIITLPAGGAETVFALLQTLTAFTPSANSTQFTLTIEGFQGRP